jgi:hypothetical protein
MIYDPKEARSFAEMVADSVSRLWNRPDSVIMDSIPTYYDHQTNKAKKRDATPSTFTYLAFERPKGVGIVSHCIITWDSEAIRTFKHATLDPWDPPSHCLPVFVEVNLNEANCGVPGDMMRRGTTAYRLRRDIEEGFSKLRNLNLWPRHPGYTDFRYKIYIRGKKK